MAIVTAREFILQILAGERDFSYIQIRNFNPQFEQLETINEWTEYLKSRVFKENPLILNGAELRNFQAEGIWLPYMRAHGTNLRNVNFSQANLKHAEFPRATFYNSSLDRANCQYCDFYNTAFNETSVHGTHFGKARFKFANLSGVKDIDFALELSHAHFEKTFVDEEIKKVIAQAIKENSNYWSYDVADLFRDSPSKAPPSSP